MSVESYRRLSSFPVFAAHKFIRLSSDLFDFLPKMVQLSVKQTTFLAALAVWVVLLTVTSAVPLEEIEDADDDIKVWRKMHN